MRRQKRESVSDLSPRWQLNRALSIRHDAEQHIVEVGLHPPVARKIEDPPSYLTDLLSIWSEPRTSNEALTLILQKHPDVEVSQVLDVFRDLILLGLLLPETSRSRYDRHQLYFQFSGIPTSLYESTLRSKSVGVVGTGGIGSTAAVLLAAAGVGTLVVSDGDVLEESNLTRSILFEEEDLGSLKVDSAKRRLQGRNSEVRVRTVPQAFDGSSFIDRHFSRCDILLISADKPIGGHQWVNEAALRLKVPFISAGYSEMFGSVGPLVIPGLTPCLRCHELNGFDERKEWPEINRSFQAASFGPLNAIMAAIATNEIVRHLFNLETRTAGCRLLIDSTTYQQHDFMLQYNTRCGCRDPNVKPKSDSKTTDFDHLADVYEEKRESLSLNAAVLDEYLTTRLCLGSTAEILDAGCGIGTISLKLAEYGHRVTAIDISQKMLQVFESRVPALLHKRIRIVQQDIRKIRWRKRYDVILLNLILDHLKDPEIALRKCRQAIRPEGRLVLVLPHPFKDSGAWERTRVGNEWRYDRFYIKDYFYEGPFSKRREDEHGEIVIQQIQSFKRNLATYVDLLRVSGFRVESISEPRPSTAKSNSLNFSKASRVPYFLILECCPQR